MAEEQSLYDRIGGTETLEALLKKFYERVVNDPDLSPFFENSDIEKVRSMQLEFFGAALGGPVKYTGQELGYVHRRMKITRVHFQKFVHHLITILNELGADDADATAIVDRINLYVDDIIGGGGYGG